MKKKHIILFLGVILSGVGCSEYKMKEYDLMDRINFIVKDNWGQVSVDAEDMVWNGEFGMTMASKDTLRVMVRAQGNISDKDRKIAFKVVPEECGIEVNSIGDYVLPAGEHECEIKLLVNRPSLQDTVFEGQLTFDYTKSDFQAGVDEQQYYTLKCSDIFDQANYENAKMYWGWLDPTYAYLGDYSETKVRFVTITFGWVPSDWGMIFLLSPKQQQELIDALATYKADPNNTPLLDENTGEWISIPEVPKSPWY